MNAETNTNRFNSQRASLGFLLLFLLCGWFAFNWFETVQRILRYYNPLPTWDYWRVPESLHSYQTFDFHALWRQHNEHRIVFPEVAFAADMLFFHGRELLPLTLSFLSYFAAWIVLAWAFWPEKTISPLIRKTGILLAGIIIAWQGSASVLANPFLLTWTLMQIAVLLSLAFLSRVKETAKNGYLVAAIVSAIIATYSVGDGLMVWPVLVGAGLLLSLTTWQRAALISSGLVAIALYFAGYHFKGNLAIGNGFRHPVYLLEFLGAYLGMPFGGMKSPLFGVTVGLAALCTVAALGVIALRHRLLRSRIGIVLFGWYFFTLLTALLTSAGRMDATDPTFAGAKQSRYLTVPLVDWAVFVLVCLWLSSRFHWKIGSPSVITLAVVLLLILGFPKLRWWLQARDEEQADEQLAALSIQQGLDDPSLLVKIFPDTVSVKAWISGLRRSRLSIFYNATAKWLGRPMQQFARPINAVVPGEIAYTFPVLSGVEVAGWADESQLRGGTGWILLTTELGQIAGFGRKLPAGFPPVIDSLRIPRSLGWVGFVNERFAEKSFSAFVVNRRGLIAIEGSAPVPRDRIISQAEAGPSIPDIHWQMDPSWTSNELPARTPFGSGPGGTVYSSWSGADEKTGTISSSVFPVPLNSCLILPVLNGPRRTGLSVQLFDSDSNQVLRGVPLQGGSRQWTFWRISLDGSIKRMRMSAEDKGRDWGEWLAIGTPRQCR